jgi:hypothetical protein
VRIHFLRWFALSGLLVAGGAAAEGFGLGVKAGTLGAGVEGTFGLSPRFNVRAGVNGYSLSQDETASGIRYDGKLDLSSIALLLDWHPFAGTFRLTAGLMQNKNTVHLTATPTSNQTIGGNTYTPAEIGTLSGDVTFKKSAPYAGFGWGNAARRGRFGFNFEVGALYQGSPKVSLSASGGAVSQADLAAEAQSAEADLDKFKIYPVVALGFSLRF